MDLNSGFLQIDMSEEDKEKTAFITSLALFQFTVMHLVLQTLHQYLKD